MPLLSTVWCLHSKINGSAEGLTGLQTSSSKDTEHLLPFGLQLEAAMHWDFCFPLAGMEMVKKKLTPIIQLLGYTVNLVYVLQMSFLLISTHKAI